MLVVDSDGYATAEAAPREVIELPAAATGDRCADTASVAKTTAKTARTDRPKRRDFGSISLFCDLDAHPGRRDLAPQATA